MRVALYKGTSLLSKLIRWQTRSEYSHAAFLCDDGSVYEAWQNGGVRHNGTIGSVHSIGTVVDIFELDEELTPEAEAHLILWLESQVGKKYDFHSVLRFVSRRPEDARDREKWFCSELVFEGLRLAGRTLFRRTLAYEVNPGELQRSLGLLYLKTVVTD